MTKSQKIIERFEAVLTEIENLKGEYQDLVQDNNYRVVTETKLPFETYPENIPVMTYVNAVKAVAKLNADKAYGHDDWTIPTLEQVRLQYKNRGHLGGFITEDSGPDYPDWYWSSTEDRNFPSYVHIVRFSDGGEDWNHKDTTRLSCRPVRLVPVVAPSLG